MTPVRSKATAVGEAHEVLGGPVAVQALLLGVQRGRLHPLADSALAGINHMKCITGRQRTTWVMKNEAEVSLHEQLAITEPQ